MNVRNGVDEKEVAREMLKAHLKKVRGMTVQDKEMEKTRLAAKKQLKSDGILRAVMGKGSSGDFEADLVAWTVDGHDHNAVTTPMRYIPAR